MADPRDVVTLDEAKAALSIAEIDDTDRDLLERLITGVSWRFDREFGPVIHETYGGERHEGGTCRVRLERHPVYSITRLRERTTLPDTDPTPVDPNEPGAIIDGYLNLTPGTDYVQTRTSRVTPDGDKTSPLITRLEADLPVNFPAGATAVLADYVAGRAADVDSVPAAFKEAALITIPVLWDRYRPTYQQEVGELGEGAFRWPAFALPNAALDMLEPERQRQFTRRRRT